LEIEESVWKKRVREDASAKGLGPYNRVERRLYAKKREGILIIKRGKRGGTSIYGRPVEKGIYSTF